MPLSPLLPSHLSLPTSDIEETAKELIAGSTGGFSARTSGGVTPAAPVPQDTCLSGLTLPLGVLDHQALALVCVRFVFGITDKLALLITFICSIATL